jgi:hypothetical protein
LQEITLIHRQAPEATLRRGYFAGSAFRAGARSKLYQEAQAPMQTREEFSRIASEFDYFFANQ